MFLLLDANLSWRLVPKLADWCQKVEHVETITSFSKPAKDREIWEYARLNNAIIVSNDDDFSLLSIAKGFPPKVVLLKTGNQSNYYILEILHKHIKDIETLEATTEYGLLEII